MAKFCTRCGNAIPEDGSPCPNCAVAQQSAAPAATPSAPVYQPAPGQSAGIPIKLDFTTEDDMAVVIAGNRIKVATVIKVVAVTLCILFFLPMFSVSCQGAKISFNGWASAFGKTFQGEKIEGNFMAFFLLLIPAALFIAFQFKKNLQFINGKLFLISTGISAMGLIGFIAYAMGVNSAVAEQAGEIGGLLTPDFTFWYYLSIILYIVAGLVSVWCVVSAKKREQQNSGVLPPTGN